MSSAGARLPSILRGSPALETQPSRANAWQTRAAFLQFSKPLEVLFDFLGRWLQQRKKTLDEQFAYLDQSMVRERLVDFANERSTRVTFHIPAIHCIACVWLL